MGLNREIYFQMVHSALENVQMVLLLKLKAQHEHWFNFINLHDVYDCKIF